MTDTQKVNIIPIEFWQEHQEFEVRDPMTGEFVRDPKTHEVKLEKREYDWVRFTKTGAAEFNRSITNEKINRLRKNPQLWAAIEPHYTAWKNNQQVVMDGTPLDACSFVSKEQRKLLNKVYIMTVEQLAESSDSDISKIDFPGIRAVRESAKRFLSTRDASKTEAAIAARDAEIEELKAKVAELATGRTETEQTELPAPKRRGRKAKVNADVTPDDSPERSG